MATFPAMQMYVGDSSEKWRQLDKAQARRKEQDLTKLRGQIFAGGGQGATPSPMAAYGQAAQQEDVGWTSEDPASAPQGAQQARPSAGPEGFDSKAFNQYAAMDPKGAQEILKTMDALSARDTAEAMKKNSGATKLAMQLEEMPMPQRVAQYPAVIEFAKKQGLNVKNAPESYDPKWTNAVIRRGMAVADYGEWQQKRQAKKTDLVKTVRADGKHIWTRKGQAAEMEAPGSKGQYGKPEFDAGVGKWYQTNPDTGKREYASQPSGMDITLPDGTKISTGVKRGAGDVQKPTAAALEKKLLTASEGLARLSEIQARFKPEYQTFATKGSAWWTALKEKAGRDIDSDEKAQLAEYSAYKRDAISNLSLYIKDVTGAQMSEPEAKRIRKGMPDPGEGIFDGDSPTEFQSKMTATTKALRAAAARSHYALKKGLDWKTLSLGRIETMMRSRMSEIETEARAADPNISDEALRAVLAKQLGEEFGLTVGK